MSLFTLIAFSLALSVLYYLCPGRFRWMLLLCSSLFFYVYSGIRALPFLLVTAGTTLYCALRIEAIGEAGKKERAALPREEKKAQKLRVRSRQRRWLLFCLLCNFGLLAVLKYTGDLSRMAASLLGREASPLGLLLPLGILVAVGDVGSYARQGVWHKPTVGLPPAKERAKVHLQLKHGLNEVPRIVFALQHNLVLGLQTAH